MCDGCCCTSRMQRDNRYRDATAGWPAGRLDGWMDESRGRARILMMIVCPASRQCRIVRNWRAAGSVADHEDGDRHVAQLFRTHVLFPHRGPTMPDNGGVRRCRGSQRRPNNSMQSSRQRHHSHRQHDHPSMHGATSRLPSASARPSRAQRAVPSGRSTSTPRRTTIATATGSAHGARVLPSARSRDPSRRAARRDALRGSTLRAAPGARCRRAVGESPARRRRIGVRMTTMMMMGRLSSRLASAQLPQRTGDRRAAAMERSPL